MDDFEYQECSSCGDILEGTHASGKCKKCLIGDINPDRSTPKKIRANYVSETTDEIVNQVLLTVREASKISGKSRMTIWNLIRSGEIKAYKVSQHCGTTGFNGFKHRKSVSGRAYGLTEETVEYLKDKYAGKPRACGKKGRIYEAFGKSLTLYEWAKETGISYGTLCWRINIGRWDIEKVLKEPIDTKRRRNENLTENNNA